LFSTLPAVWKLTPARRATSFNETWFIAVLLILQAMVRRAPSLTLRRLSRQAARPVHCLNRRIVPADAPSMSRSALAAGG
jgi:hypothetical protein